MKKIIFIFLLAMFAGLSSAPVTFAEGTYKIDAVHSTIGFAVKHLVVSTTRGQFKAYTAEIEYDKDDLSAFKADVTIQVASVDTDNEERDKHLRSPDFFDVEKYPTIIFKSSALTQDASGQFTLAGDLTIRDVTKKVYIPIDIQGPINSPFGFTALGITGEVMVNRQDFGVSWNKALDEGGFVVGDEVRLIIEIEAHSK